MKSVLNSNRNCILLPNLSFYRIILPNKKISKTLRIVTTTRLKEKTQTEWKNRKECAWNLKNSFIIDFCLFLELED